MPDQELQLNRTLTVEFRTYSVRVGEARRSGENRDGSLAEELKNDYHTLSLDDVSTRYNTNIKGGLDGSSAANRLARNGKNVISPPPSNYFKKFIDYTFGGFSTLLWIASIICFLAYQPLGGDAADPTNLGLAILLLIVIFIQIFFNAYQDYSSSKVMASINNMLPSQVIVSRDSKEVSVPTSELVLGDLVHIKYGNKIPADLRIIQTSDLKLDKSVLTGEVEPVNCTVECTDDNHLESKNVALMGTLATNGQGLGIVVATGDRTVMGKIAKLSSTSQQKMTLLQLEIQRFVYIIAALSLTTASLVMILWGAWLRVEYPTFLSLSAVLVNAISVLVAFVPEGLPVAVTLTLTLIARRMAANNVLVKNLTTVETLGSVNVIASDKTGTLTQNRMTVTTAVLDKSYSLMDCFNLYAEKCPQLLQMIAVSGLCNGASFDSAQLDIPIAERKVNGDATDSAILRYAEEFIPQLTQMDSYRQLQVIPFNSKNKWMLSLYKPKNSANPFQTTKRVLMMKGAPDVLIPHCKYILTDDGREVPFDEAAKKFISDEQIRWSSQGQRVLMLTRAILDDDVNFIEPTNEVGISSIVSNLTIIGLLGIIDPPRDQIPETIVKFKSAGIRIFMVTGDFALTAAAIARQIGILTSDDNDDLDRLRHRPDPQFDIRVHGELKSSPDTIRSLVLTGTDINALTEEDWGKVCSYDEIVFARTTPEQKLKIVQEFQARDNIVGVTGDGVNDSPALKCANIGIAMGGGSEVAMEAAHMVLLDNNFTSIVTAIESGRLVFDNLKKVILYLLPAGSFSEMVPILINAILGVPLPLSPFLMIVICVLTDMISSLAIMCEKPESDLLLRPPRRPKQDRLVNFRLLLHAYGFIGIQETLYAHIAYFTYMKQAGGLNPSQLLLVFDKWTDGYLGHTQEQLDHLNFTGQTIFFVTLVIMQCCGNLFSTRTRKVSTFTQNPAFGPTRNPYVILSIIGSICISLIVVYVPFFNNVFKTRPIPLQNWFIPIGFAMLILIVEEFRKFMIRRYPRSILGKLAW